MALTHKYTLVCDEARREENGKIFIIGLYTPGIVLPRFPFKMKLTFLNYFQATSGGSWQLRFKIQHGDTAAMVGPTGAFKIEGSAPSDIVIPITVNLEFQLTGDYQFILEGEQFETVSVRFPVSQRTVQRVH